MILVRSKAYMGKSIGPNEIGEVIQQSHSRANPIQVVFTKQKYHGNERTDEIVQCSWDDVYHEDWNVYVRNTFRQGNDVRFFFSSSYSEEQVSQLLDQLVKGLKFGWMICAHRYGHRQNVERQASK